MIKIKTRKKTAIMRSTDTKRGLLVAIHNNTSIEKQRNDTQWFIPSHF